MNVYDLSVVMISLDDCNKMKSYYLPQHTICDKYFVTCLNLNLQIYMGVVWQGGKLGLVYYDLDVPQIYMMLDTVENDDFSMLKRGMYLLPIKCTEIIFSLTFFIASKHVAVNLIN